MQLSGSDYFADILLTHFVAQFNHKIGFVGQLGHRCCKCMTDHQNFKILIEVVVDVIVVFQTYFPKSSEN